MKYYRKYNKHMCNLYIQSAHSKKAKERKAALEELRNTQNRIGRVMNNTKT
jgi:hypothetical protein